MGGVWTPRGGHGTPPGHPEGHTEPKPQYPHVGGPCLGVPAAPISLASPDPGIPRCPKSIPTFRDPSPRHVRLHGGGSLRPLSPPPQICPRRLAPGWRGCGAALPAAPGTRCATRRERKSCSCAATPWHPWVLAPAPSSRSSPRSRASPSATSTSVRPPPTVPPLHPATRGCPSQSFGVLWVLREGLTVSPHVPCDPPCPL